MRRKHFASVILSGVILCCGCAIYCPPELNKQEKALLKKYRWSHAAVAVRLEGVTDADREVFAKPRKGGPGDPWLYDSNATWDETTTKAMEHLNAAYKRSSPLEYWLDYSALFRSVENDLRLGDQPDLWVESAPGDLIPSEQVGPLRDTSLFHEAWPHGISAFSLAVIPSWGIHKCRARFIIRRPGGEPHLVDYSRRFPFLVGWVAMPLTVLPGLALTDMAPSERYRDCLALRLLEIPDVREAIDKANARAVAAADSGPAKTAKE